MQIPVEIPKTLSEGKKSGAISRVEYRTEPYSYPDIFIRTTEDGEDREVKYGCPTKITSVTKLGKLLVAFGAILTVGASIDPENILVGKKCTFMVQNVETDRGEFSRVIDNSIKPQA